MDRPPWADPFDNPSQAIDAGYTAGAELRKNGARPEHLAVNIEMSGACLINRPLYADWVKGFRAGFLGERKPAA